MQEPNALMWWVMFHFAGGDALVAGFAVILLISFLPELPKSAWRRSLITFLAAAWGGLSSPAWPWFWLLAMFILLLVWRVTIHWRHRISPTVRRMNVVVQAAILVAMVLETGILSRRPERTPSDTLCVIADSITAGLNDGEVTWPRLLSERSGLTVQDASQPGATLRSAWRQAEFLNNDQSPLIMEIGGNDLLSGLPVADFARDCESLCAKVCTPGRRVWMCELPLPPVCSRYGVVQRSICRRYGIHLIPKRTLMRLLTTAGATVDSIHLSPRGQELFLSLVTSELRLELSPTSPTGDYRRCDPRRIGEN